MISAVAFAEGEDCGPVVSMFHATFWALVPPIVAIGLALITKEVYSSLFRYSPGGTSFCKFCTGGNAGQPVKRRLDCRYFRYCRNISVPGNFGNNCCFGE